MCFGGAWGGGGGWHHVCCRPWDVHANDASATSWCVLCLLPIHSTLDQQLDEDYEFSTDLMAAARYMPLFRRAARALVRYREALNAARQRVLQVRAGAGGPWCRYGMGGSQLRTFLCMRLARCCGM